MKDTFYFPHDYHARHDPKLERLRMEIGPVGDGIFWDLVEMLYEENGYLLVKDLPIYVKMLNTDEQTLNRVIGSMFLIDGERFYNQSLLDRLNHIKTIREERKQAGKVGGVESGKQRRSKIEAKRSNIKESKVKESKEDKVKDIELPIVSKEEKKPECENFHYYDKFEEFWQAYPKRVGQSLATMTFRATIKSEEDFKQLMVALKNYLASKEVRDGYIKNGSNWIEDWKGWLKTEKPKRIVKQEAPLKPMTDDERKKFSESIKDLTKQIANK